ncbi:MAG: peptidoglycan-binding domain-containing protein, partial [Raoultibacter sp.]
ILALALVIVSVLAISIPAFAADYTWRYSDDELYTNSGESQHIMNLQSDLNIFLRNTKQSQITVDGYFGQNTKNAVIKFQNANNLSPDGRVGPLTKNALYSYYLSH